MSIFKKLFGQKDDAGESPEFKSFLDGSMEALRLQTAAHQGTWHFGEEERWDFAQDTGELVFTFPKMMVRAPAQIIGKSIGFGFAHARCPLGGQPWAE